MTQNLSGLLEQAVSFHDSGNLHEASKLYQSILALEPNHAEALHRVSLLAKAAKKIDVSLAYLDKAIALQPDQAHFYLSRGTILDDAGEIEQAISSVRRALSLRPGYAEAYNYLGLLLHDQNNLEEALVQFEQAVHYDPQFARGHNNLGNLLRAMSRFEEAEAHFRRAIEIKPDYGLAYHNLGLALMDLGRLADAEAAFSKATLLQPDYAPAHNYLGHAQRLQNKFSEAEASFRAATRLMPDHAVYFNNLGYVLWEQGKLADAVAAYKQAWTVAPGDLRAALGFTLSLPPIYQEKRQIDAIRERYALGVSGLKDTTPKFVAQHAPQKLLEDLRWSNFYLAYQGLDDKTLQIEYAEFVANILKAAAPQFMQPVPRASISGRRLRVGFLSNFFTHCTVGMYFKSWITKLDKTQFDIFVYHIRPDKDWVTEEIMTHCEHFRQSPGSATSTGIIAAKVKQDELDILVYPELGMEVTSFVLAAMRLAPVQVAGWGHPVTSGHMNIDYYLSSASMEPPGAESHYSEKLVKLPGLGTWYTPARLPDAASREDYALPPGRTLYLCPQSLFKVHPDNDALFVAIAKRDPNAVLVFFSGRHPTITQLFLKRLTAAFDKEGIAHQGRGVVLPYMSHASYLQVNMLCDVMLDTLHWSGGNTSLDAIACGLPIVTLPGEFMRGRQSYGMLSAMGLQELIAKDEQDYTDIALRLGNDAEYRQRIARRIKIESRRIFEQQEPIRELEKFFLNAA